MTNSILYLLQLASPALPVGAYSYSEGLETLVEKKVIDKKENLCCWLKQELKQGAIRQEAAVMKRCASVFDATESDLATITYWNAWLSAARETEELRLQSWQMGQSLLKLLVDLQPSLSIVAEAVGYPCNYAVAFGIAAGYWQIEIKSAIMGYLQSWASNLINAGVKLIPIGQTSGQEILLSLHEVIIEATEEILILDDEDLSSCSWGLSLASMAHQTQYTRLFRS